jgi:hypothetical protein
MDIYIENEANVAIFGMLIVIRSQIQSNIFIGFHCHFIVFKFNVFVIYLMQSITQTADKSKFNPGPN